MTQPLEPVPTAAACVEEVEIQGHIIDSLLLPKVLDEILTHGGTYVIKDIRIGQRQADPSFARIEVRAPSSAALHELKDIPRKMRRHPLAVTCRDIRRKGRRLVDHRIAREQVGDICAVPEMQRKIEWPDDHGWTQRAAPHCSGMRAAEIGSVGETRLGVGNSEIDFGDDRTDFALGLGNRLAGLEADAAGEFFLRRGQRLLSGAHPRNAFG